MKLLLISILFTISLPSRAQDNKPLELSAETAYYNFWEGSWYKINDAGVIDSSKACFRVTKGIHPACWKEEWGCMNATGIRTWDKTNQRWMHVWISENGLFQVWEGRKSGNDWYMYKEFDIQGDKYLSRQGVIPIGSNRMMRISEKSYDNGKTWQPRFKEYCVRLSK